MMDRTGGGGGGGQEVAHKPPIRRKTELRSEGELLIDVEGSNLATRGGAILHP